MDKQAIRELTETLNRCIGIARTEDDVEDRVRYLVRRMREMDADDIQSGGLYVIRDNDLGGYEVGIKIPTHFMSEDEEI